MATPDQLSRSRSRQDPGHEESRSEIPSRQDRMEAAKSDPDLALELGYAKFDENDMLVWNTSKVEG